MLHHCGFGRLGGLRPRKRRLLDGSALIYIGVMVHLFGVHVMSLSTISMELGAVHNFSEGVGCPPKILASSVASETPNQCDSWRVGLVDQHTDILHTNCLYQMTHTNLHQRSRFNLLSSTAFCYSAALRWRPGSPRLLRCFLRFRVVAPPQPTPTQLTTC